MGKTDYKRLQKKLGGEVIKVHNELEGKDN